MIQQPDRIVDDNNKDKSSLAPLPRHSMHAFVHVCVNLNG